MKILKTMRDVRTLARNPDVDSVNAYTFRSAEEVQVYLEEIDRQTREAEIPDQGVLGDTERAIASLFASAKVVSSRKEAVTSASGTGAFRISRQGPVDFKQLRDDARKEPLTAPGDKFIRLDDFGVVNTKKLESQFQIIYSLHRKLEVLDAMELTVKQAFAGERQALSSHIVKTRAAVTTKLKAALSFISKAAQKKEPKQFTAAVTPAVEALLDRADGMYKKPAQQKNYLFTKTDKTGVLYFVFQRHVVLQNFKSDDEAFTYPQYVIVFTAAVSNDKKMTMHVTTLHQERPPGTFKAGASFTDKKSCMQELDALLDMDKMVDLMSKLPMPKNPGALAKEKFTNARQHIRDVKIDGNVVKVFTKRIPNQAAQSAIVQKIFLDLKTLLGYGKGQSLKYKSSFLADKTAVLEFVVVPNSGSRTNALTERQMSLLETHFGFDDDDIAALIRVLQKGF